MGNWPECHGRFLFFSQAGLILASGDQLQELMPTICHLDIDVTSWLPLLCDGKLHHFSLKVVGFDDLAAEYIRSVGENWWVTGAVFVWLDKHGNQTRGDVSFSKLCPFIQRDLIWK
jgi:Peptide N-acetyl-beta-D-glucosaminyl asparaginase amidase A